MINIIWTDSLSQVFGRIRLHKEKDLEIHIMKLLKFSTSHKKTPFFRVKSDNLKGRNREKYNIAILEVITI